ncbi:MAG: acyl-CoA dehydrogenase family protein [Sinobacteraceae bacterium]|nr:acyl-CoA dehydrogenase family protein [Nevskiaceae bacterium]
MNLEFSAEERALQREVRQWLQANKPNFAPALTHSREQTLAWEQTLAKQGWLVVNWPQEYGGPGWTATQRYIWDSECARANVPGVSPFGVGMCAPVLMAFGTDEQKAEHLPHMANATRLWCQGYSEPGSGSDLASLKTRAVRDGDVYMVTGQKTWTTSAHIADWMFALVRTSSDGRKQEGISFVLIDMATPGIEVREIRTIDGEHHLNEVFFEDVPVPAQNLVGDEGRGWTVAKYLLGHERTSIARVPFCHSQLAELKTLQEADPAQRGDTRISEDIAALEVDLLALEFTNLRALERAEGGKPPGAESSGLKIKGSELQQALAEYRVEMGGDACLPWKAEAIGEQAYAVAVSAYNIGRASTIYGGSNEIQRNVLAKLALGA